jgi:uncharacterized membrane protein
LRRCRTGCRSGVIVTLTGLLELAGAIGMLNRAVAPWAGLGLSALLAVMFPANVTLALSGTDLPWWDQLVPRTVIDLPHSHLGVVLLTIRTRRRHDASATGSKHSSLEQNDGDRAARPP